MELRGIWLVSQRNTDGKPVLICEDYYLAEQAVYWLNHYRKDDEWDYYWWFTAALLAK
jgi:hypothetical protein